MDTKIRPQEPMVTIPIGMDCSHTEWRHWPDMNSYIKSMIDSDQIIPAGMYKITKTIALAATRFMKGKRDKEHLSRDTDNER